MAMSELQIALIGAGTVAVGAVWGYNIWQDRQHRKTADKIFKGGSGDALHAAGSARTAADGERQEPHIANPADDSVEIGAGAEPLAAEAPPAAEAASAPASEVEWLDRVADCVLHLVAAEPIPAPAVWAMQNTWSADLTKHLYWLARNDAEGDGGTAWRTVDARDTGRYREWAVALQLVDRRGPVADAELARFFEGVQQVAQQAGATLDLPSRADAVLRAAKLDEFCATVDIQFVLNVVEASGGVFAGTKLRGVAEALGLVLEADGVFRAHDSVGGELFTVGNLGTERLAAESIKSLATHGLTLSLDVPRVMDGRLAFDRMLAVARQLGSALDGVLVDAQRAPLSEVTIAAMRAKTGELQQRMRDAGINPGSPLALRLFS